MLRRGEKESIAGEQQENADAESSLTPSERSASTVDNPPRADFDEQDIRRIAATIPARAQEIQDVYPLSPLQEGVLFHHLLSQQEIDPYVLSVLFQIEPDAH